MELIPLQLALDWFALADPASPTTALSPLYNSASPSCARWNGLSAVPRAHLICQWRREDRVGWHFDS